jgi:hypothetical protein
MFHDTQSRPFCPARSRVDMGCGQSKDVSSARPSSASGGANNSTEKKGGKAGVNVKGILQDQGAGDVRDFYTFDRVLGKGNFGVVHLVFDKKTKEPYACKSISKRKLVTPEDIEDVRREVQILLHLAGHANVVQLYGAYEDKVRSKPGHACEGPPPLRAAWGKVEQGRVPAALTRLPLSWHAELHPPGDGVLRWRGAV